MITVDYVDLERRPPGVNIVVTHNGGAAYVEVITADNFHLLQANKEYQCVYSQQLSNGQFTYTIPSDDHWYVVAVGDGTLEVDLFAGAQPPGTPVRPVAGDADEFTLPSDPSPRHHLPKPPGPVNPPGGQPQQHWILADLQRMNDQAVVERAPRVAAAKKALDAARQNFDKIREANPDQISKSRVPRKYTPRVVVEAQKNLDSALAEYGDAVSKLAEVPDYSDGNGNMLSISDQSGKVIVADPIRQYTYIYSDGKLAHSGYWDPGQTTVDTEFEGLMWTVLGGVRSGAARGIKALLAKWGARKATSAADEGVQVVDEIASAARKQAEQSKQRLAQGTPKPTSSGVTSAATRIAEEIKAIPKGGPSKTATLAEKLTALRLGQTEAAEATNIASKAAFGETAGIASLPDGTKVVLPIYLAQRKAMQVFSDGSVKVFEGDLNQFLPYLGK